MRQIDRPGYSHSQLEAALQRGYLHHLTHVKRERTALLLGLHARAGAESPLRAFAASPLFDPWLLALLFSYVHDAETHGSAQGAPDVELKRAQSLGASVTHGAAFSFGS